MTAAGHAESRVRSVSRRFDERFLRKLESLVIAIRRLAAGQMRGSRRSRRVGAGIEFADHRDYVAGDDLRYLDWNLYGRLERLALRVYEEDEDLSIDVLVDASGSMAHGGPDAGKLDLALQVGAALGYVGLANLDQVAVTPLGEGAPPALPPARGKARILPILRQLDEVRPTGKTALAAGVRALLGRRRRARRGLVILISDFYDPDGYRPALDLLRHHKREVAAIQVSAPEELAPRLRGDVRLRDVETGEARDLTISPAVLAAYTARREALVRGLEGYCRERGVPCFAVVSDEPFDAVVLRMFRAGGLLR